jgi:restriction system protein
MPIWVVRGGKQGERDTRMLELSVLAVGWRELGQDLNSLCKEELAELVRDALPEITGAAVASYVGQLWSFVNGIQQGDLVVLPRKNTPYVAIGETSSGYRYRLDLDEDMRHTHDVKWLATDVQRIAFHQDLQNTFNAFKTVFQVQRADAEPRLRHVLQHGAEPNGADADDRTAPLDVEQAAQDEIVKEIDRRFKGHDFARLAEGILQAQGYFTFRSPPGPDGGVDILAGSGKMGFDAPRICVQVKARVQPADIDVYQRLKGTMQDVGADQGLLVSWGGFTPAARKAARNSFFAIRLWERAELMAALLDNYDRLPADLKAELPLRQIWVYVRSEEAS